MSAPKDAITKSSSGQRSRIDQFCHAASMKKGAAAFARPLDLPFTRRSEDDLRRQLQNPWIVRARPGEEIRGRPETAGNERVLVGHDAVEIRPVRDIERLPDQPQPQPLANAD